MYPIRARAQALTFVEQGHSLNSASKQFGISRAAIREWRESGVQPKHRPAVCFRCEQCPGADEAAYSLLLGYYLEDGCISSQRSTFSMRVSCDKTYTGIIADVTSAIKAIHEGGSVCHVRAPGVIVVQNAWNHWPCTFPQHGPGRKHERKLTLEAWQRDIVVRFPADFLRGLFHSDGCRVKNRATRIVAGEKKRYDYPRWMFNNNSSDIMRWCQDALDLLGIPWRQPKWNCLAVSTKAGVTRLDELIGLKS